MTTRAKAAGWSISRSVTTSNAASGYTSLIWVRPRFDLAAERKSPAERLRVSTEDQTLHGVSLDAQRDKLADYCRLYGHEIVEVVADEGLSGKSLDRPGLRRALAIFKAHAVEGLAV